MRLALLFSGQGWQRPEHWQQVRRGVAPGPLREALLEALPEIDGVAADPPVEALALNQIAQPLIFAQQMLLWNALRHRLPRPICAAGYSLGELAACSAAGAFTPAVGVRLCSERARLMDRAVVGEHGMLAVLGLDDALVATLATESGLAIAIRNAPRHLVVAGPRPGLITATRKFEAAGASRLVPLAVRTPSHTPMLAQAAVEFRKCLDSLPDGPLDFPVLSAIDAASASSRRVALDALARQIAAPLDWSACLQAVLEMQPDAVLEIGPGNSLARLIADLAPAIPVRASDDFRSIDGIVRWIEAYA